MPAHVAAPQIPSASAESVAHSRALKKQGWKFVGPTTVYAFMQAIGLICAVQDKAESSRKKFRMPHSEP
jgi:DNA-3-methyladenine glycosylase I